MNRSFSKGALWALVITVPLWLLIIDNVMAGLAAIHTGEVEVMR